MEDVKENIDQSLDLLFKVEGQSTNKKLLLTKPKTVYLHIVLFKVPFVHSPIKKFLKLRYSLYGNEPEICLFVPNRKSNVEYKITTDEYIDFCIDFYTEFLKKHKIKGITTVMPLKQLRSEYGPFEMRRKLVRRYDLFLCKNSLLHDLNFVTAIGSVFRDASREPLGVTFPRLESEFDPSFQKNIDRAIFATSFVINRSSDNYTIPFGSMSNSKSELKKNLITVLDQLIEEKMIPGGIENVRMMNLLPSQSKPIPLFINTRLPPKFINARPILKRKKRPVGVEGELSTQPGKKVVVMPNGEVFVTNAEDESEIECESDESLQSDSMSEGEDEQKKNDKLIAGNDEENSESEDDEKIEEREHRLLSEKIKAEDNSFKKQKKSRKAEEEEEEEEVESVNEEWEAPREKKMKKADKEKSVKKRSSKKALTKQGKFKAKKKVKQKKKMQKKV